MRQVTAALAAPLVLALGVGCGGEQEKQTKKTIEPAGTSEEQSSSKAKTAEGEAAKADTEQSGKATASKEESGKPSKEGGSSSKAKANGGGKQKKAEKEKAGKTSKGESKKGGEGKKDSGDGSGDSGGKAAGGVVRVTDNPAADLKVEQPKIVDGVVEVKVLGVGTLKANAFYYNIKELHVRPGQKVRVIFKNVGKMPKAAGGHQFIVIKKGTSFQTFVAKATQAGLQNDYIPQGKKMQKQIIAASALLGPGEQQTIEFTAPKEPGKRTFLCTFPGHYATMRGKLVVEKP